MRCRTSYITHFLCFTFGIGFTLVFFTFDFSPQVEIEKEKYDLMIAVLSAPRNLERRIVMRKTLKNSQFVFAIGGQDVTKDERKDLIEEQEKYGDLVILPLRDNYDNLTAKVLLTFSHLIFTYEFNYLLKCDDDTFINVIELQKSIKVVPKERLYWGYFSGNARVQSAGKWAEKTWFLCDRYLPYALGGAYVLTYDLVLYIVQNSHFLTPYRSEDVSVGVWLAPLNITRSHDSRFDTAYKSRGCRNDNIAIHHQSVADLERFAHRLNRALPPCEIEFLNFQPYRYNWTVLPSKCCN